MHLNKKLLLLLCAVAAVSYGCALIKEEVAMLAKKVTAKLLNKDVATLEQVADIR